MLNEVDDIARELGWWVISDDAAPGLVGRLVNEHLPTALQQLDADTTSTRLTGVSAPLGLGSLAWDTSERHAVQPGLRT